MTRPTTTGSTPDLTIATQAAMPRAASTVPTRIPRRRMMTAPEIPAATASGTQLIALL